MHVLDHTDPVAVIDATAAHDERWVWIGEDERGRELEIVACALDDCLLVIHVLPTIHRRKGSL